jgi:hypothetical protein
MQIGRNITEKYPFQRAVQNHHQREQCTTKRAVQNHHQREQCTTKRAVVKHIKGRSTNCH